MTDSPWRDKQTLERLYWGEGMSQREVANELGCSKSNVTKWMKKYDVDTRKSNKDINYEWDDEETLRTLYWQKEMSLYDMADELDTAPTTICNAMDRHGIERRGKSDSAKLREMPDELVEKGAPEWCYEEMRKKPANYVVDSYGYSVWRVSNNDKYHAIGVHRLVALAHGSDLGKVFSDGKYHVHHKNGIPWDNRPENLEVLSKSEHHSLHNNPNKGVAHD